MKEKLNESGDLFSTLKAKYGDMNIGNEIDFQVYKNTDGDILNVSWELTFRRNNKTGAFRQYSNHIRRANAVLDEIARQYKEKLKDLRVCTLASCQNSDAYFDINADSEYEQSIGGSVQLYLQKDGVVGKVLSGSLPVVAGTKEKRQVSSKSAIIREVNGLLATVITSEYKYRLKSGSTMNTLVHIFIDGKPAGKIEARKFCPWLLGQKLIKGTDALRIDKLLSGIVVTEREEYQDEQLDETMVNKTLDTFAKLLESDIDSLKSTVLAKDTGYDDDKYHKFDPENYDGFTEAEVNDLGNRLSDQMGTEVEVTGIGEPYSDGSRRVYYSTYNELTGRENRNHDTYVLHRYQGQVHPELCEGAALDEAKGQEYFYVIRTSKDTLGKYAAVQSRHIDKAEAEAIVNDHNAHLVKGAGTGKFVLANSRKAKSFLPYYHKESTMKAYPELFGIEAVQPAIQEATRRINDMTRQYKGFEVYNPSNKEIHKFPYQKGVQSTEVENKALSQLRKDYPGVNFMVSGFIKHTADVQEAYWYRPPVKKDSPANPDVPEKKEVTEAREGYEFDYHDEWRSAVTSKYPDATFAYDWETGDDTARLGDDCVGEWDGTRLRGGAQGKLYDLPEDEGNEDRNTQYQAMPHPSEMKESANAFDKWTFSSESDRNTLVRMSGKTYPSIAYVHSTGIAYLRDNNGRNPSPTIQCKDATFESLKALISQNISMPQPSDAAIKALLGQSGGDPKGTVTEAPNVGAKFKDSQAGAIECLNAIMNKGFVKRLDVPSCVIQADPAVAGVWAFSNFKTGTRFILYMGGYRDPMGKIRQYDDGEEGEIPPREMKRYQDKIDYERERDEEAAYNRKEEAAFTAYASQERTARRMPMSRRDFNIQYAQQHMDESMVAESGGSLEVRYGILVRPNDIPNAEAAKAALQSESPAAYARDKFRMKLQPDAPKSNLTAYLKAKAGVSESVDEVMAEGVDDFNARETAIKTSPLSYSLVDADVKNKYPDAKYVIRKNNGTIVGYIEDAQSSFGNHYSAKVVLANKSANIEWSIGNPGYDTYQNIMALEKLVGYKRAAVSEDTLDEAGRYGRSWAILPATEALYNKKVVDIYTAQSQWQDPDRCETILVCNKEQYDSKTGSNRVRTLFVASSGDCFDQYKVGQGSETHHDQTGASKGYYTIANVVVFQNGEIIKKANDVGLTGKYSLAVFK